MGCACLKSNPSKETKSIFVINNSSDNRQNNENNNAENRQSIYFLILGNRQQIRNSANEERPYNANQVRLNMHYNQDFNMPELGKKII